MLQIARYLQEPLSRAASRGKARLVLGARQTGKSTLYRLIRKPADLMIDLQERGERMRFSTDPATLSRELLPPGRGHRHVLVDEVQRVPELLDEIQLVLDRHPGKFTFTLTGSSARRLRRGGANLLPGRVHRFHLGPVCLWEEAGAGPRALLPRPRGGPPAAFPPRSLEERLVYGCLPAAYVERARFADTLASYSAAYIEEEVLREMAARNLGAYGRFLELAAIESGKPINLTKVSQESGVPLSTIRGFYSVLEDTLLGFSLAPFTRSERGRITKTAKFYFFDVGVRNATSRLPLHEGILSTQAGQLFEHWVACELQTRIAYLGRGYRLGFWRTVDGAEVDFVLETPRETFAIEVKHTARPRPTDARGIEHFIERHPGTCRRGFLICRAPRRQRLSEHVTALPWNEM
jgi:predicted AAA+ superfamily ATPase